MSRCAQVVPSATNSRRNAAAYSAPPQASGLCWLRSAILVVRTLSCISSGIGSGHICSPAPAAISGMRCSRSSSLLNTPDTFVPSATTQAPVKVATSTIRSGLTRLAVVIPSARTSRPSASVLRTSTVLPPYMVRTSPGRVALPDGMFSARQAYAVTRTGQPELGDREGRSRHRRGPGHVALHRHHRVGRLDRQAAGVEGDALADERDVRDGLGRLVGHGDQSRAASRALADAQDAAVSLGLQAPSHR